jgi:hypothetical protein
VLCTVESGLVRTLAIVGWLSDVWAAISDSDTLQGLSAFCTALAAGAAWATVWQGQRTQAAAGA